MRSAAFVVALSLAGAAAAEGFAVKDLQAMAPNVDISTFVGGEFVAQSDDPHRLTVLCPSCEAFAAVDVILGEAFNDTEDRLRQGLTDFAALEAQCQSRNPSCTLEPVSIGPALGWASSYELGDGAGATSVLFLGGETLTIRSLGPTVAVAVANGAAARDTIGRAIVGE